MSRRLRLQGFTIQPHVVWDDGDNLEPGPMLNPVQVAAAELGGFAERWPEEFAAFREQIEAQDAEQRAAAKPNRAQRRAKKPAARD